MPFEMGNTKDVIECDKAYLDYDQCYKKAFDTKILNFNNSRHFSYIIWQGTCIDFLEKIINYVALSIDIEIMCKRFFLTKCS